MLGRRARPALPPTHICLGVPESGRRVPGAAQGVRSCPRRGHRNLHPLVSGVGGTRATRVFSKGDLTRGEARPRTKGLSYSLGHTHFITHWVSNTEGWEKYPALGYCSLPLMPCPCPHKRKMTST